MPKARPFLVHLSISLITLAVLLGGVFYSAPIIRGVTENPKNYFNIDLDSSDVPFFVVFESLLIDAVLVSYVVYLLLTSKSRTEMQIWVKGREVLKSREQFIELYENAPVPYIMLNKKGEIKEPNKSALRFFGVLPEEILDKDFFSYSTEEDNEKADMLRRHYTSGIAINREEINFFTKKGETKSIQLSVFNMASPVDGQNTGLAMIFDITEQKNLDKAKSQFVSLASHQLKAPLATMKWYTEMLMSGGLGDLTEKQKEYVERLYASNTEMIDLVDVLLNVSRIELGSLPVNKQQTDVEELTESIFSELSPQIEKKKINIDKQYGGNLKNIKSDPKLLRIVIQNLISNAVKYTREGGTVTVTFVDSLMTKKIIVADNGIGIPKSEQNRVFSKLFRAHNALELSNTQGTGLGLYMVKSIVRSIGGDISFASEENKGSVFTITF